MCAYPGLVGSRTYGQYCAVARALDVIGERWSMLVLRELLLDERLRFADLLERLGSISTDVLTRRLRTLEEEGLVERVALPPPAARVVYQLTDRGKEVKPVVVAAARFGFAMLGEPAPDDAFDPRWLGFAVRALLGDRHAKRSLVVRLDTPSGSTDVDVGPHAPFDLGPGDRTPAVWIRADVQTLAEATEPARVPELLSAGRLLVEGEAGAVKELSELLSTAEP
jgi:DNA-binding HxlR family transcriptional regulator